MCSIFGYYKLDRQSKVVDGFAKEALKLMKHRGPDAQSFKEYDKLLGLGNHRLSIIDTRAVSNQPIDSSDSSIVFNGEVYNYLELAKDYLKKVKFRTASDTEVLQKGLEKYGLSFLKKTNGMFAFAWYKRKTRSLVLGRDRFGVKPLHYTVKDGVLYFSSEIRPLMYVVGGLKRNKSIYRSFFEKTATDYDQRTFVEGIFQVRKGEILECKGKKVIQRKWYRGNDFKFDRTVFKDKSKTLNAFEDLLVSAISVRLRSDVPVCMTLSGGLDSSLIYTLIKERLGSKVTLFTYVNQGSRINEIKSVLKLTRFYGDKVYRIKSKTENVVENIKSSLRSLEFPVWDVSSIAYSETYKRIRGEGYKVVIEGHGSDELLGGYPFLILAAVREMIIKFRLIKAYELFKVYLDSEAGFEAKNRNSLIEFLSVVRETFLNKKETISFQSILNKTFDYQILPIVLRTFDRLTMAHSIESRSPFMDYRVVEFLKKLPLEYKVSKIGSKAILREVLKKYGKDYIYENKKKIGFGLDYSNILSDRSVKDFFVSLLKKFKISGFNNFGEVANAAIGQKKISNEMFVDIWKVAAVSYLDNLYNID